MATVMDVYRFLDEKAPFSTQLSFDNAGFLVGRGDRQVSAILVALDITETVAEEAVQIGAELIVSHHPVIFSPARHVTDQDPSGRRLLALLEHNVAAICAHTNLDIAAGGVNDALAWALGLEQVGPFSEDGIGRTGVISGAPSAEAFAAQVKKLLGANGVRFVDGGRPVRKVAVGGGACGDMGPLASACGCDTFVTSDVKYHEFQEAEALGLNLIDAGHYPTENVVCPVLAGWLQEGFPGIRVLISHRHHEVFSYV